jgi:starch-binding outer membrane protein, SusD/RagB family
MSDQIKQIAERLQGLRDVLELTPDEVLEQAISDFKEAKSRLPKLRSSDENGRVTQGAAIAMLGKAYIWKGDYQAAKDEFEIIMNGYGYDLTQKYEDNFRDDTEFNAESIWEINYDAKGNSGDAWPTLHTNIPR